MYAPYTRTTGTGPGTLNKGKGNLGFLYRISDGIPAHHTHTTFDMFHRPHRSPPSIPVAFMVPRLHVGTSPCRQLSFAGIATIASSTIPVPTIATLVQFQRF